MPVAVSTQHMSMKEGHTDTRQWLVLHLCIGRLVKILKIFSPCLLNMLSICHEEKKAQKHNILPVSSGNLVTFCESSSLLCTCHSLPVETDAASVQHPNRHSALVVSHEEALYNNTQTLNANKSYSVALNVANYHALTLHKCKQNQLFSN